MVNFRKFELSSGKRLILGRNAENNEEVVAQVEKDETVLHTAEPGSPFGNIKGEVSKKDVEEAAVYVAKFSQDWRDNNRDIKVHIFKGKDIYKRKVMKTGTFGVNNFNEIIVSKRKIQNLEAPLGVPPKSKLRGKKL